jgi:hypothetical protein
MGTSLLNSGDGYADIFRKSLDLEYAKKVNGANFRLAALMEVDGATPAATMNNCDR